MYDLLIRNALLLDGLGSPPQRGDLAVTDGRIAAVGKAMWVRGPGRAALLFGDRLTSLTRSLRVSNGRLRDTTGWAPGYPSAREGWMATADALESVPATAS